MKRILVMTVLAGLGIAPSAPAGAARYVYTNQSQFDSALSSLGYTAAREGFEDDAAWGAVRSVSSFKTAPSVTSGWITWSSYHANGAITTGHGAAVGGLWGLFAVPHGDYADSTRCDVPGVCGDGFKAVSSVILHGVGGWILTNTPPAKVALYLDGGKVGFGNSAILPDGAPRFFGVIETTGFSSFAFFEEEGTRGDMKMIFGDDFTTALLCRCPVDFDRDLDVDGLDLSELAHYPDPVADMVEFVAYFGMPAVCPQ